jgi:hypothetical protein
MEGRYSLPEALSIYPEIGQDAFDKKSCFEHGQSLNEQQGVIAVIHSPFPASKIARTRVVSSGEPKYVISHAPAAQQLTQIALSQGHVQGRII